jgi:hypothetical protein
MKNLTPNSLSQAFPPFIKQKKAYTSAQMKKVMGSPFVKTPK